MCLKLRPFPQTAKRYWAWLNLAHNKTYQQSYLCDLTTTTTQQNLQRLKAALTQQEIKLIYYEHRAIGYCWLQPKTPDEIWLLDFYLVKRFRKRGLAKSALSLIIKKGAAHRRMKLAVAAHNHSAYQLYLNSGFTISQTKHSGNIQWFEMAYSY